MTVAASDIIWRASALISDSTPAQNGGRMNLSSTLVTGVKNNLFPDVSQAQRTAGVTQYRKAFLHVAPTSGNVEVLNGKVFLDRFTPGEDYVLLYEGNQTDTQNAISGTRAYGVAKLKTGSPISANDTTCVCAVENIAAYTAATPFRAGDTVRISDRLVNEVTGHEEYLTVDTATYGTPTGYVTLAFTTAIQNAYSDTATNMAISSVITKDSIKPSADSLVVTSQGGGTFNLTDVVLSNRHTVEQIWTLTFTSATNYTITCDTLGITVNGNSVSTATCSTNGATYVVIPSTAFGGTFAANNTIVFATHPATIPVFYKRVVLAGTTTLANDSCSVAFQGEST